MSSSPVAITAVEEDALAVVEDVPVLVVVEEAVAPLPEVMYAMFAFVRAVVVQHSCSWASRDL